MGTSAKKTNRQLSRDLGVIGVRLLDDARMTWVAAEVESERALGAWFEAAASRSGAPRVPRSGRPRGRGSPRPAAAMS